MRRAIFTLPILVAEKQRKQNQTGYLFLKPQNLRPCIIQTFGSLQLPTRSCGILPKKCHMAPSPLATQAAPLATRGIAHSTRMEIIAHSTQMSHIRNSVPPTFYFIRMSHSRNSVRPTSHFSGYLTAAILSGRRSIFSRYFTFGACCRMVEEDDSTSPDRHVRILW